MGREDPRGVDEAKAMSIPEGQRPHGRRRRESRDPTGWRLALITALALIGLGLHSGLTGPEFDLRPPEAAMARIFHAALLGLVVFFLFRLRTMTEGRGRRRLWAGLLLFLAGIAGTGLLLRDFGVM